MAIASTITMNAAPRRSAARVRPCCCGSGMSFDPTQIIEDGAADEEKSVGDKPKLIVRLRPLPWACRAVWARLRALLFVESSCRTSGFLEIASGDTISARLTFTVCSGGSSAESSVSGTMRLDMRLALPGGTKICHLEPRRRRGTSCTQFSSAQETSTLQLPRKPSLLADAVERLRW